jgi:hypothetical protein
MGRLDPGLRRDDGTQMRDDGMRDDDTSASNDGTSDFDANARGDSQRTAEIFLSWNRSSSVAPPPATEDGAMSEQKSPRTYAEGFYSKRSRRRSHLSIG